MASTSIDLTLLTIAGIFSVAICITAFFRRVALPHGGTSSSVAAPRTCDWRLNFGVGLSIGLYLAACVLPVARFGSTGPTIYGFMCLVAVPYVLFVPYWHANLILFYGIIAHYRGRHVDAAVSGCLSTLLATSFFILMRINQWEESNNNTKLLLGSRVWLASLALFAFCTWRSAWSSGQLLKSVSPVPVTPTRDIPEE